MKVETILSINPLHRSLRCGLFGGISNMAAAGINSAASLTAQALANKTNKEIAREANVYNAQNVKDTNEANILINEQTNEANREIAQEANALNLQVMREQNDWNYNMWQEENAYNDPSQQIERLMAAGINPNMAGSAVGGSAAGNTQGAPEAAPFAGAETATMNPISLDAAHNDPYKVAALNPDFLGPLMAAAGIARQQAETENIKQTTVFQADQYGTISEMNESKLKLLNEQLKDFIQAFPYRRNSQAFQLAYLEQRNKLLKNYDEQQQQILNERKQKWEWAKDMQPTVKRKLEEQVNAIVASIDHMKAQDLFMKAQERHMIAQDRNQETFNKNEEARLRMMLKFGLIDRAFKAYALKPSTRHEIATALAQGGSDDISQFFDGLRGAADGNYNTWFQALQKQGGTYYDEFQQWQHETYHSIHEAITPDLDPFSIDSWADWINPFKNIK